MSLTDDLIESIGDLQSSTYEGRQVYAIDIELKEVMISKNWQFSIDPHTYSLRALKLDHSGDPEWPDEIIVFDGEFQFKDIRIPRFRHWYLLDSGEYQGSDIIVRSVD